MPAVVHTTLRVLAAFVLLALGVLGSFAHAQPSASEQHSWDSVVGNGAGRLVSLVNTASSGQSSASYDYDASDALVRERRMDATGSTTVLRFGGYRYDARSNSVIEKPLTPHPSLQRGRPRASWRGGRPWHDLTCSG